MVAAKTMAKTGMDLFDDPAILKAAKKEFEEKRGADFEYIPLLGDREPALDYRNQKNDQNKKREAIASLFL